MTFEAHALAPTGEVEDFGTFVRAPSAIPFPANDDAADPEAGWASRNPGQALLFLFVNPRPGAVLDELMAL